VCMAQVQAFFLSLMGWTMRRPPQIFQKTMMHRLLQPKIQQLWWLEKQGSIFFHPKISFSIYFDPKHLENTLETLLNHFMATKRPKNSLKTRIPPGTKILLKLIYVVLGVFKVKQTPPSSYGTFWYKNQLFWWSKSSPTTTFSL